MEIYSEKKTKPTKKRFRSNVWTITFPNSNNKLLLLDADDWKMIQEEKNPAGSVGEKKHLETFPKLYACVPISGNYLRGKETESANTFQLNKLPKKTCQLSRKPKELTTSLKRIHICKIDLTVNKRICRNV